MQGGIHALAGFVENRGQWPDEVLFFARRYGVEVTVTRDALVFRRADVLVDVAPERLRSQGPSSPEAAPPSEPLILRLPGAAIGAEGIDPLPTLHHFLTAAPGAPCTPGAAGFERVVLRGVQPGIDVLLRSDGGVFSYDLLLEAGAVLESFVIEVDGAKAVEPRSDRELVLNTPSGGVSHKIGASWQGSDRRSVACSFRALEPLAGRPRFGFAAPGWDRALPLVLDPSLVFLTYVGGAGQETLVEMEMDASGAVYLLAKSAGGTPVTPGAFQESIDGLTSDAWIGKLSPDGSTLEWATFLGGSETEDPKDMALDADGSIVLVGGTWSPDFPVTPGAIQSQLSGGASTKSDIFVARLAASGSELVWATYYGGPAHDIAWGCGLYPNGDVLVAFEPWAPEPAATPGAFDEVFDDEDRALFRLTADGTQRLWQTYLAGADTIDDLLVDDESNTYLVGHSFGPEFPMPTTPGVFKESLAPVDSDGYVTVLSPDGAALVWSTYVGGGPDFGSGLDRIYAVALDAAKAVYVAGYTHSDNFPVTAGAFQSAIAGGVDGFAAKLLPNGTDLVWATYIAASGFAGFTSVQEIVVDSAGNAIVFGHANEPDFPVTPDAFQPAFIGPLPSSGDTLLCKLDAVGESLVYGTWLGGNDTDTAGELAVDIAGNVVAAFVAGPSLPTTPGAYQTAYEGSGDLAVAKFDFDLLPWTIHGDGLAGGEQPSLVGVGSLVQGSTTRLALRGAPSMSPAWLVAGALQVQAPLLGGTLVPFPSVVVPITTAEQGEQDFTFSWPAAPTGLSIYFQAWMPDPLAPLGWSASNALQATAL
jgi:hypothetical protein